MMIDILLLIVVLISSGFPVLLVLHSFIFGGRRG
jgi:hypothetical protein